VFEAAPGSVPTADPRPRLRDLLGAPGSGVVVAELVPWSGALDDPASERTRKLAGISKPIRGSARSRSPTTPAATPASRPKSSPASWWAGAGA
jgi:hypothetical protein